MYEITFILRQEDSSEVKKILEKSKADIINEEELKKIHLSYPIKKQNYGFLGIIRFRVDPESVESIFSDMKLSENIIRYMVNKIKASGEGKIVEQRSIPTKPIGIRKELLGIGARKSIEPILTNEDIEKKIEEISQ